MEGLEDFIEEWFEDLTEWVADMISDLFPTSFLYEWGVGIWNMAMGFVTEIASTTPRGFSSATWEYVVNDVSNFTTAIGAALLNLFYFVGVIRQSTNLKENFTLEIFVDNLLKMLLANMLLLNGIDLMQEVFSITGKSAAILLRDESINFATSDMDAGGILFTWMFGFVFLVVSIVCAFTIMITIYGRYLQLYLLVATYPLAMSTLPGGTGVNNTASSWVRTFLAKTLEIVIIALTITIASKMCNEIDFLTYADDDWDGMLQILQSMATMIILSGSVKGIDVFIRRAFGL